MYKKLLLLIFALLLVIPAQGQTDNGLILSAGLSHKINKKISVGADVEMRTRNDFKTMDRWIVSLGADYKIAKYLKASLDYNLMIDNNKEKISYDDATAEELVVNKWTPSYWSARHRFNVSFTGSVDAGHLSLSLRERWQYTYSPESEQDQYDFTTETWGKKTVNGKGKSVLRSRFQVEYNFSKKSKVTPFVSTELFNSWSLEKIRIIGGANWKLTKQHSLSFYYRYQIDRTEGEPNMSQICAGYNFKF